MFVAVTVVGVAKSFGRRLLEPDHLYDGKPIVALTLRHDRVDNFWFALLHELVHVHKHLSAKHLFIADNLEDKTRSGREEDEADAGAREALIPAAEWKKPKVRTTHALDDALELANRLRIHPAIVAGRVRYETANWRLLSTLVGTSGEVSRNFEDQLGGLAPAHELRAFGSTE